MGASNDSRANSIADFFARAGEQVSRMNETVGASKANVTRRAQEERNGRATLKAANARAKSGVHYQKGKSPEENLSAAPTLHLINGKTVKGTANAGGITDDSAGNPVNTPQAAGGASVLSKDDWIDAQSENVRKSLGGGHGGLGDFIADAVKNASKNTPLGDVQNALFNNSDPLGRPQNAGQWAINALSTGLYTEAGAVESIADEAEKMKQEGGKRNILGDVIRLQGAATSGAARGVAEGFGARFDDHTPATWGKNLERAGTKKALEGALGKQAGDAAQGVIGGVADIVGDPTTYLTLGGGGLMKGAAAGAREASVAGKAAADVARTEAKSAAENAAVLAERYSGKTPTPKEIAAATKATAPRTPIDILGGRDVSGPIEGAIRGAGKGWLNTVTKPGLDLADSFAGAAARRQFTRDVKAIGTEGFAELQKLPTEQWADAAAAMVKAKKTTGDPLDGLLTAPSARDLSVPKGLTGVLSTDGAQQLARGAQDLLPNIVGQTGRQVPTDSILARASQQGGEALIGDSEHAAIQTAIATASSPSQWLNAVKKLQADPKTAAFLDSTMKVGSREMKVAEVARKLATSDPLQPAYRRYQEALDGAYTQAKGRAGTVESAPLGVALAGEGFGQVIDTGDLATKLNAVPHEARKAILQTVLGGGGSKRYDSFDAAIKGAVAGQVDASMMRTMLAKVGITTKLRDPEKLKTLLGGQGTTNWEQIKASVRTPQEVLDVHGIDDSAVAAAEQIDLADELPKIADHYQAGVQAQYGYDPTKIAPLKQGGRVTGDSTGAAIYEAQQSLGTLFRKGEATEAYDNAALVAVHKSIMREISQKATMRGVSGERRALELLPKYRQATRTVEGSNLASGIMPRIVDDKDAVNPLFVSWGQIADALPDDVLGRALFSPDMGRRSFDVERAGNFKQGFTAYPNVIANGVRAAANGADAQTVAIAMRQLHGNISRTAKDLPELDAIYGDIANAITNPAFVQRILELDARQQPLAYAFSRAAAEGVVTPLSQRIMEAVNELGSQGVTRDKIYELIDASRKEATSAAGYPSLVSDMVQQRMDNGFVNGVLGEYGSLVLNAQERAVKANRVKGAANGGARLRGQNDARVATLNDFDSQIDDVLPAAANADEELANLMTKWELQDGLNSTFRMTQRLGVALEGRYGMQGMKDLLVGEQTLGFRTAAEFNKGLRQWVHGRSSGMLRVGRTGGLGDRIAQGLGRSTPLSYEESRNFIRQWWQALAAVPEGTADDAAAAMLRAGARPQGLVPGTRGLADWEIPLAQELKRNFIDNVFDEGGRGLFSRSGLQTSDVLAELRRYKTFKDGGEFAGATPNAGIALDEQSHIWRDFDVNDIDPLDVLDQYFGAMSAASVKPSMGAQLSKNFGIYNPSPAEISKHGLKRLNTAAGTADLAKYVDPNAYFAPAEIKQMSFLQQAMNYSRQFPELVAPVVRVYDALTRVLKSSATVWRPGHHVTNILGDSFMNLLAGVNPLNAVRGVKMMRIWGQLADADMGPLAELERLVQPMGKTFDAAPNEKFFSDTILVRVNGKIQPVSLQQAVQVAHRTGVAMSHSAALDILGDVSTRVTEKGIRKLGRQTIGRADDALGHFSAVRDNVTRLPHFISALEKGNYRSLDEAFNKAASEVHDYHPTALNISGFEQKYLRRLFYFYTWTRQAASRIIRTAADRPGLITIPSKLQFEMATANGLNPESIGVPIDPDNENIASYNQTGLLGPTYFGGLTPSTPDPNGAYSWGYSLSSPQIDTLQMLFQGANTVPGQTGLQGAGNQATQGTYDLLAGSLNPLIKLPTVLATGKDPSSTDFREVDKTKWLADQGGVVTTLSKLGGGYQQAFPGALDKNGKPYKTPEQVEADRQRALANFFTGMKFTNYDDPTSTAVAASERREAAKRAAKMKPQG